MISIIIPTLNEEKVIRGTVEQFKWLTMAHEVIVVDGGSTDGTVREALAAGADRVWRNVEGRGTAAGNRNVGARLADDDTEWLVFVDADERIPSINTFFEQALEQAWYWQLAGLTVAMKVGPEWERGLDAVGFFLVNLWYEWMNNWFHVGAASGGFMMVRRKVFWLVGGLDEGLVVGEDNDFFWRVAKAGRTMMLPWLYVLNTGRRAHQVGWGRLVWAWGKNAVWWWCTGKSRDKEWRVVR